MSGSSKLAIWDEAWLPWAGEFERRLSPEWEVSAGSGLPWLVRELPSARALVASELLAEARAVASGLELMLYPRGMLAYFRS